MAARAPPRCPRLGPVPALRRLPGIRTRAIRAPSVPPHPRAKCRSELAHPGRVLARLSERSRSAVRRPPAAAAAMAAPGGSEWQEVATSAEARPTLPRSGHCAAALPSSHTHDVIIFGGYVEDASKNRQAANDAWALSIASGQWMPIKYAPGPAPRVRLAAQAVVVGDSLWLIGGWDPGFKRDGGEILNDVWVLDLESYAWRQINVLGEKLAPISRFQAAAVGNKIYIHTHHSMEDILVLDVSQELNSPYLASMAVASPDGFPASRGLHTLTETGGNLWLFGGAPKQGPMLGDLWELNVSQSLWQPITAKGEPPHVRCSQGAASVGHSLFLFGGSYYKEDGSGLQPLQDLNKLDLSAQPAWQPWPLGPGPSPRNAATLVAVGSRLVLYGGWYPFMETYNDTWLLDVSSNPTPAD